MPIIPSNWTGSAAVNAIGIGGGSGSTSYAYANSLNATITELDTFIDLVGVCDEPISREVSLDLISGKVKLYWKGLDNSYTQIQIFTRQSGDALVFTSGYNFVDLTLGQLGLSIKCSELTEISLVLRWDKDIEFNLYSGEDLVINPKVRLLLPTGANYPTGANSNAGAYDATNTTLYTQNLNKLKNSESDTTGFKLFDIYSFYPGKPITFNVIVLNSSSSNYGNIAFQLLDPVDIGQAVFDVANDIINLENNTVTDKFIGNLTRDALYKDVTNNQVILRPDFSRHVGRIVAQDTNNNNYYDTVIIKSYTPNTDPLLGGTFTLTGEF
jgi:hypothetical protein